MRPLFIPIFFLATYLSASPGDRTHETYPWSVHPLETVIHSRSDQEWNKTMAFCSRRLDPEKYARVVRAIGTISRFLNRRRGWADPAANWAAIDGLTFREMVARAERAERTGVLRLPKTNPIGRLYPPYGPDAG